MVGTIGPPVTICSRPVVAHTYLSVVNMTRLPNAVPGVTRAGKAIEIVDVAVKDRDGYLMGSAIPNVTMVKYNRYVKGNRSERPKKKWRCWRESTAICIAIVWPASLSKASSELATFRNRWKTIDIAAMSDMPVVPATRGDEAAIVPPNPSNLTIEGSDLTAATARHGLTVPVAKQLPTFAGGYLERKMIFGTMAWMPLTSSTSA